MKNKAVYIFYALLFFSWFRMVAQPGPYGGDIKFKVYENGKIVDLSKKSWKIIPNNITLIEATIPYEYPDYYRIVPYPTPMGGMVAPNFYLDIIHKKDTMRLYPPSPSNENIVLDSIPFLVGTYKIPKHIYDLKETINTKKARNYKPELKGDWEVFSIKKFETFKCYIEKVEDFDYLSKEYHLSRSKYWDRINLKGRAKVLFRNHIIMVTDDEKNYSIYNLKLASDTTFWGEKIMERLSITALFYKNDTLFALIDKIYRRTWPSGSTSGIYKLHFVDEIDDPELIEYLQKKQIEEDYQSVKKFSNLRPDIWGPRFKEITEQYKIIKKEN